MLLVVSEVSFLVVSEHETVIGQDPNALLEKKFKGDLLEDVKKDSSFTKKEIVVDLNQ